MTASILSALSHVESYEFLNQSWYRHTTDSFKKMCEEALAVKEKHQGRLHFNSEWFEQVV